MIFMKKNTGENKMQTDDLPEPSKGPQTSSSFSEPALSLLLSSLLSLLLLVTTIFFVSSFDVGGDWWWQRWGCDSFWVRLSWPKGAPPT